MKRLYDIQDIEKLYDLYDWVRDMKDTPQDPIWHGEGDVFIHTKMVLSELMKQKACQDLPLDRKRCVWEAALLHDVEKRSTTRLEDERIVSPGHAKKGMQTTRKILYTEFQVSVKERERIAKLVRYHGLPLWALEKPNPAKAVIQASLETDTELLAVLAEADIKGRICSDKEQLLENIGFFKELCLENDCWGKPKSFPSKWSIFNYFNKENASIDYVPFDDFKFEVVLLSALPGTGKDTHVAKNYKNWFMISLDDIRRKNKIDPTDKKGNGRVVQMAKEQAKVYMRKGESFVWNATNITRDLRSQLIGLFTSYGGKVIIDYLEVPYKQMLIQNKSRDHILPDSVIHRMLDKWDVPQDFEAHEVRWYK